MYVTWLIHMRDWLIHVCDMTRLQAEELEHTGTPATLHIW